MSIVRTLKLFTFSISLLSGPLATAAVLPAAEVPPTPPGTPRLLLKGGLRLNHLFYLPDQQSWQLVLPSSLGLEYRFTPRFSLYSQLEADLSAGRAPRGRRRAQLPTTSTDFALGARYYFNQPAAGSAAAHPEPWGNYLALESSAELAQIGRGGRRGHNLTVGRVTPALFVLCGTQHGGPGRHLLYDLNAGLGIVAPPAYAAEAKVSPPWTVASQVNLRVYLVNHQRPPKLAGH
ncbi:hypothetical protein [Hymenobacter properus]|uniref:DUF3575 domain-containing protein n=1 Tax=Hymenobacter properus TaxID=2791026 RepID=A0A931BF38_9BACT|nr:hypothetical protein [Hymenobacter properus]MBF9142704.1 hypothetical protein [Hymenobacter properus]MBR7721512.1 hypothetical protein [Microvirga sp. SRT04]